MVHMNAFLTLLEITIPVFIVVAAGYTAVRIGHVGGTISDALVQYAVRVAVPCLLFLAMIEVDLATAVSFRALIAFFLAGTVCFLGAMILSRLIWKRRPGESVAIGFCSFFPNVVMLGIPIIERAYGGATVAAMFGIIAFHSIYNYFVGFIAMEMIRRDGTTLAAALTRAFVTTFKNPLMIGLVAGMAVNLSGLTIPGLALDALEMIKALGPARGAVQPGGCAYAL